MRLFNQRVWQGIWLVACVVLTTTVLASAQSTSTFNGRILDQGEAVLPGVTVTATNASTGVTRTTVTNAEGAYSMPGLDPGVYTVRTDLQGFAAVVRERVALGLNATITLDFRLALAGLEETLTVTGQAPLIETTQSAVISTIETTEVQNLPMITRSINGMLELLPGATPMAPIDRTKQSVGNVSFGGSSGTNMSATVDGADNRDQRQGGTLMNFTLESLEQFQLATSQFGAADGRTGGVAISLITKSGTNVPHGSAFIFARDKALTAKDYFSKQDNLDKVPFSRQQSGGSIGGPLLRNRMFFFGAGEFVNEDTSIPVPARQFDLFDLLLAAEAAGKIPRGLVNPNHPRAGAIPHHLTMYSLKTNLQVNNNHSLMGRWAGQTDTRWAVTFTSPNNDLREPEDSFQHFWSGVVQHGWVMGNSGLNQLTGHVSHNDRLSDLNSAITGEHYSRDFPNVNIFPPRLAFPTINTGAGGAGGSLTDTGLMQIRDDVSLLEGTHALKFGANFGYLPRLGVLNANEHFATLTFFDDPSVILSNSNGRYPQGFQTPGIVQRWQQANGGAVNGVGSWAESRKDARQFSAWFQDDWRTTSRLTLNLGVRYDVDYNFRDEENNPDNATRLALEAIGHPYGALPKTQFKNISPRVGFAFDLTGDGRRVLRGGYGLYFDQINHQPLGDISSQSHRPLNALAVLTNTAIGVGELATYRFGIDPFPAQPTEGNSLPPNSAGQWLGPNIMDPRMHHMHIGYAHALAPTTMVSVDYTHEKGTRGFMSLNINPLVNRVRVLAPDFNRVFGRPDVLSAINVKSSIGESEVDMLTFKFQRRLPRMTFSAHYTLAGAYAYGGSIAARGGSGLPQDSFDPLADGEWGPTPQDERHRLVASGVFELPFGLQVSPVFQTASARPYNLTAGSDLNADGNNNDRWIDPATGRQVSINAGRGDSTVVLDLRSTKFFQLGGERRIAVFAEIFNVLDNVNFGGNYTGNGRSVLFNQPAGGFIPGIGYPRQVQLGARFLF
jgi:carboxypeptidase family protein/TonB-dependent receptor-like protein